MSHSQFPRAMTRIEVGLLFAYIPYEALLLLDLGDRPKFKIKAFCIRQM